jgi:hypothetical protein
MIDSREWESIIYKGLNRDHDSPDIDSFIGLDSEAYESGEPFLFCFSDRKHFDLSEIIPALLSRYNQRHITVYNLKYDSGAIIYSLPDDKKYELWEKTETEHEGIKYTYIPHKHLKLTQGKKIWVKIWDIAQFYKMSLDAASKKYLNRSKGEIETKSFSPGYVKKHLPEIIKYCVLDAVLCAELSNFFLAKIKEFGIRATALYSCATLSFTYFRDRTNIIDVWRFWQNYPAMLQTALDAYQGGKFEVTARGKAYCYEYDIASAYPYEIANLVDISCCRVERDLNYRGDAVYGFMRVRINNSRGLPMPCGIPGSDKITIIYPAGVFHTTITKNEFDYLIENNVDTQIIDAWWLFVKTKKYPYRGVVDTLFDLKSSYKGRDEMLYNLTKIMLNSFYGKLCQVIPDWQGNQNAGIGWNPIHAAVITANTRLKVTREQLRHGENCLAVHTDSVILKSEMQTGQKAIGEFELQHEGETILMACGQYEIGDKGAYRGFKPSLGDSWRSMLEANRNCSVIKYPIVRVESWVEAIAKGHYKSINVFNRIMKKIDLNADVKRIWMKGKIRAADLLDSLEYSIPYIVNEKLPEWWKL